MKGGFSIRSCCVAGGCVRALVVNSYETGKVCFVDITVRTVSCDVTLIFIKVWYEGFGDDTNIQYRNGSHKCLYLIPGLPYQQCEWLHQKKYLNLYLIIYNQTVLWVIFI